MFKELDIVRANKKINEQIPEGTEGVIHEIFPNDPNFYLIEFVDSENNTICVLEVSEKDITRKEQ